MSKITEIWYNWVSLNENVLVETVSGKFVGESFGVARVGENGVIEITYHPAQGEGDRHRACIIYENGNKELVFNLNKIFFQPLIEE